MTRQIRLIETEQELSEFTRIQMNAYPASEAPFSERLEHITHMYERDGDSVLWGLWDDGIQVGNMRVLDFQMNFDGRFVAAGGIGSLAVDLLHKKKGAARDLVQFFLKRCREKGQTVALLYPFRPDFYYRMGFGYGTKVNHYRFRPHSLPNSAPAEGKIEYLVADDAEAIRSCHDTYAAAQHGWCTLSDYELGGLVRHYCGKRRAVGYWASGELQGYLLLGSERTNKKNFISNNLVVRQWIYNTPSALRALCSFLHRQADQYERIVYNTQDADFHHLLADVRNDTGNMLQYAVAHETNLAGVGLMYRVVSMADFLANTRQFGETDIDITLEVEDTFCPANAGQYNLSVRGGRPKLVMAPLDGVTVSGNIADLSAMLMGSVDLRVLYRLGKVRVDPNGLEEVANVLKTRQQPMCITAF